MLERHHADRLFWASFLLFAVDHPALLADYCATLLCVCGHVCQMRRGSPTKWALLKFPRVPTETRPRSLPLDFISTKLAGVCVDDQPGGVANLGEWGSCDVLSVKGPSFVVHGLWSRLLSGPGREQKYGEKKAQGQRQRGELIRQKYSKESELIPKQKSSCRQCAALPITYHPQC